MTSRIQIRRGTAANWIAANPILADGEMGFETDTRKIKTGNGLSGWTSLPYTVTGGGGGSGSVTSDEASAISAQAASALSVIRNNVSVLSQAVSVISQQVSALSQAHSALSQQVSVLSVLVSNEASMRSQSISVASAAATSADAHASIASAAATSVNARVTSVVNTLSALSVRSVGGTSVKGLQSVLNALSNRISTLVFGGASVTSTKLSNEASIRRADDTSILSIANDARSIANQASNAASQAKSIANAISNFLSGLSARSAGGVSTKGLQSILNALSNRISAGGGTTSGTVTSNHISILSQQISVLSQQVSVISTNIASVSARSVGNVSTHGLQSVVNALSNRISAAVGGGRAWVLVSAGSATSEFIVSSLTAYTEIRVLFTAVTQTSANFLRIQVSNDNGATYKSTSGDYIYYDNNAQAVNATRIALENSGGTGPKSGTCKVELWNLSGPKTFLVENRVASTPTFGAGYVAPISALNALRVDTDGGALLATGFVYVFGLPT